MTYYLAAAALVFHSYFWGAGISLLALPRVWRCYWWAFAPCFGLALQSAVVWAGAHSSLAGTDVYARASEGLPLVLGLTALGLYWRTFLRGIWAARGLAVVMLAGGWLLLSPMASASKELTTLSMGGCDHADYAAGARVFQEFAHGDRTGLLGQPEVTSVGTAKAYFDFWLRLNHFTPSAVMAHNCSILGLRPWQIAGVTGVALALLNLPGLILLCRKTVGLRGGPVLLVAALYIASPLNGYAVDQGFLAQLYAAIGIATLTTLLFLSTEARRFGVSATWFVLPTIACIWLLAGSYNFILLVAFVPGAAWLAASGLFRRDFRPAGQILLVVAFAFAVCIPLFWGRFDGIAERMRSFEQSHFGWPIPLQSPEGILGLLRTADLAAWPAYPRILLGTLAVALWAFGLCLFWRRNRKFRLLASVALVVPVLCGWGLLAYRTQSLPTASYDAYKLVSVFLPGLITGLCCWLPALQGRRFWQLDATFVMVGLLGGNLWAARQLELRMTSNPLRVDQALVAVGGLESNPKFDAFNVLIQKPWDRLWSSHFLLKKPQYFKETTFEGRRPTALKARWSLFDETKDMKGIPSEYHETIDGRFQLVRDDLPGRVDVDFATGWYNTEKKAQELWKWSSGDSNIVLRNPGKFLSRNRLRMRLRAINEREIYLLVEGSIVASATISPKITEVDFGTIAIPSGAVQLSLTSSDAAVVPGGGDQRKLSFSIHCLKLDDRIVFGSEAVAADQRNVRSVAADLNTRVEWTYGPDWHALEKSEGRQWRWSAGHSTIRVINRFTRPLPIKLSAIASSVGARELQLLAGGRQIGVQPIVPKRQTYELGEFVLPPGETELVLHSPEAAVVPGGGDRRQLSFALWGLSFRVVPARTANAETARILYAGKSPAETKTLVAAEYGTGWYKLERSGDNQWRWSSGNSILRFFNPRNDGATFRLKLRLAAPDERTVSLSNGGAVLPPVTVGKARTLYDFGSFTLQPGYTEFRLVSREPPFLPGPPDTRKLTFGLFEIVIEQ
jgi:hypothetical protein